MAVVFHFLNAGVGDCTIVHFPQRTRNKDNSTIPERIMMVDIYHSEDSADSTHIIDYYKKHFRRPDGSIKPIFRFVCTHPHQDHICGLAKLVEESGIDVLNFWDLAHDFEPESTDKHPTHEDDWRVYQELRSSAGSPKVIRTKRGDQPGKYWDDDEDRIVVLSPSDSLHEHAHFDSDGNRRDKADIEIDEMSYALMIKINSRKVVLAGDGRTTPCWDEIYESCVDEIKGVSVLKAGHHGHEASVHDEAVKAMDPCLIVFSNSKDEDRDNGAEKLYAKAVPNALILKTCDVGTIVVEVPYDRTEKIRYSTET